MGDSPARNPYIINGKNTILSSYCVYLDILGFSEETKNAFEKNEGHKFFERFITVTSNTNDMVKDKFNFWRHKIFTDNIVLGYPIRKTSDGESEFGFLIPQLINYQLNMALEGFFVRGAFSIGELFVGEETVYGPAILEAHELENKLTNNPRIILSQGVTDLVKAHLKYYAELQDAPQYTAILVDTDGQYFINYLFGVLDEDDYSADFDALQKHKNNVENCLNRFREKSRIWSKYFWLANYHNYFCKLINDCPNDIFINPGFMTQEPKTI